MSEKKPVSIPYTMDLGCCGMRDVMVGGYVHRDITQGFAIEIECVTIRVGDGSIDLFPYIQEKTLAGMRQAIKHAYFSEYMPQIMRDGSSETGVPA